MDGELQNGSYSLAARTFARIAFTWTKVVTGKIGQRRIPEGFNDSFCVIDRYRLHTLFFLLLLQCA